MSTLNHILWSEVSGAGICSLSVHDSTQVMLLYHKFAILVSACHNIRSQFISHHYTVLLLYLYPAALDELWCNPLDLTTIEPQIKIQIELWYKVSTETSASVPVLYQSLQIIAYYHVTVCENTG